MLKIWNAANFRRTLGGICLIAAPLLFAFVEITAPPSGDSPAAMISNGVRYHDRLAPYAYLGLAAGILFIVAIIAALHVVRGTGVVLAHVGAILAMLGNAVSGIAPLRPSARDLHDDRAGCRSQGGDRHHRAVLPGPGRAADPSEP